MVSQAFTYQPPHTASQVGVALTIDGEPDNYRRRRVTAQFGEVQHRDLFNTDSAADRRAFINAFGQKARLDAAGDAELLLAIDQRLCALADAADAEVAANRAAAEEAAGDPNATPPAEVVPEEVRQRGTQFLHNPNILQELIHDFGCLGIAGEEHFCATIYLVGTSRLLDQPLSAVAQSASSSGKSHLSRTVLSMLPEEHVFFATDLTPQSLYYMRQGSLVHKVVYRAERAHADPRDPASANASLALREMLSQGCLDKFVTIKGRNGQHETVHVHQDGPISLVETTTMEQIFEEDAT